MADDREWQLRPQRLKFGQSRRSDADVGEATMVRILDIHAFLPQPTCPNLGGNQQFDISVACEVLHGLVSEAQYSLEHRANVRFQEPWLRQHNR